MSESAHKQRSRKYATRDTSPTQTDQAGAHDTDINLIVKRYGVYGQAPGASQPPIYGDFADVPTNLADGIRLMRSQGDLRGKLPQQLRDMPLHELLTLTNEQLNAKLAPPAPTPVPPKEEPK